MAKRKIGHKETPKTIASFLTEAEAMHFVDTYNIDTFLIVERNFLTGRWDVIEIS